MSTESLMSKSWSMLGLADLLIPGMIISLSSRFDSFYSERSFPLLIFIYFTSLFMHICIEAVYIGTQPALVYIVPLLISGIFGFSAYRGRFLRLWTGEFSPPITKFEMPMEEFK